MGFVSKALGIAPPSPAAIPPLPPGAAPATLANSGIAATAANSRTRAAALEGGGQGGTAGPLGSQGALSAPPTANAQLLGGTR